jgi:hypothetical protein
MTFVFALLAGVGFASTNIADVTLARAPRATRQARRFSRISCRR